MRRARNTVFAENDQNQIWAVNLGADYVSEHEWGIKQIQAAFGLDHSPGVYGADRIRNRALPDGEFGVLHQKVPRSSRHRKLTEDDSIIYLSRRIANTGPGDDVDTIMGPQNEIHIWNPEDKVAAAWSGSDFALRVRNDPDRAQFLDDLYEAALEGRMMIWLGGGGVFQNSGLCLGIFDRAPAEFLKDTEERDRNNELLAEADEKTGIREFLIKAGEAQGSGGWSKPFSYYALRADWSHTIKSTRDGEIKTEYPVIYFLNPQNQKENNFGWFTIENLRDWTEGKGPIPKKNNPRD